MFGKCAGNVYQEMCRKSPGSFTEHSQKLLGKVLETSREISENLTVIRSGNDSAVSLIAE